MIVTKENTMFVNLVHYIKYTILSYEYYLENIIILHKNKIKWESSKVFR